MQNIIYKNKVNILKYSIKIFTIEFELSDWLVQWDENQLIWIIYNTIYLQ